jgi:HlyD family secretion protein
VLTVPIASVTTRLPKDPKSPTGGASGMTAANAATPTSSDAGTGRKNSRDNKPIQVVFVADNDHAKMVPVKIGVSDDSYWEITDGLKEGDEVVSGGFRAINRDLDDGKKIVRGVPASEKDDDKKP